MEAVDHRQKNLLTIAGSDCSGGAGIQADLKTFTSLKCYGLSVITAITAQNTLGVDAVAATSHDLVAKQLEAVASDIQIDGIKTGMLCNSDVIESVAVILSQLYRNPETRPILVIDPVMVSTSGHNLLEPSAVEDLTHKLFPQATIVTPNIPEALLLTAGKTRQMKISSVRDMVTCCKEIIKLGARNVLLKGGHLSTSSNEITDVLCESHNSRCTVYTHPRINTTNTHGTGCTLSAALTVYLSHGIPMGQAVQNAIDYLIGAMRAPIAVGRGSGPLNHFFNISQEPIPCCTFRAILNLEPRES